MPGKDGQDGVPGIDGEKVGAWWDVCWEEVGEEFSFPRPQHHYHFLSCPNHYRCREKLVATVPQERRAPMGCR